MRVVFLQDVPNVATAGEVREVADGYGRNYLIPRRLAALADRGATQLAEAHLRVRARVQAQDEARLVELAHQLDGKEITLRAKSGANDRIYGSITTADIAVELKSSTGLVIDKKSVELDKSIRQLGSYEVAVRLSRDIVPRIKVMVTGEETG